MRGRTTLSTVAKQASRQTEDVYLENRVLVFPRVKGELPKHVGLERARRTIQALRGDEAVKMSFGGRVTLGPVNHVGSLRNYYPSLRVAEIFAQEPSLAAALPGFLDSVSMPPDVRASLLSVVCSLSKTQDLLQQVEPESPNPVGEISKTDLSRVLAAVSQDNHEGLLLADDAWRDLAPSWWPSLDEALTASRYLSPEMKMTQVRLFARANELELSGAGVSVGDWTVVLQQLPPTAEAVSVLLRLASAADTDPSSLKFHGQALSQWTALVSTDRPTPRPRRGRAEVAQPLGKVSGVAASIKELIHHNELDQLDLDDADVRIVHSHLLPELDKALALSPSPEMSLRIVRLFARRRECEQPNLRSPDWFKTVATLPATEEAAAVLRRAMKAFGDDDQIPDVLFHFTGAGMALNLGCQPLGDGKMTADEAKAALSEANPEVFELDDDALREVALVFSDTTAFAVSDLKLDPESERQWHLGAFRLWERGLSLGVMTTKELSQHLKRSLPRELLADDAILLAAARVAVGAKQESKFLELCDDPDVPDASRLQENLLRVRSLKGASGAPLPVRRPAVADALAAADSVDGLSKDLSSADVQLLERRLAALDPSGSASAAVQQKSAQEVLLDKPRLEFGELVSRVTKLKTQGRFQPVSLEGLDAEDQSAIVEKVVQSWGHVGAGTIAAGLLLGTSASVIRKALEGLGYRGDDVALWAEAGSNVARLDGATLTKIFGEDSEAAPRDFEGLLFTLRFAELPLDEAWLTAAFEEFKDAPQLFIQTVLNRAAASPNDGEGREVVRSFINARIDAKEIDVAMVRDLVSAETLEVLEPSLERRVDDAVTKVIQAGLSGKKTASLALKDELLSAGRFVNTTPLVERALGQLYASDLANVLPMGQADLELGVSDSDQIEGQPAFDASTPTVNVASIELKINDAAAKDHRAVPKKQNSELVMTATTERNLKLISAAWRRRRPVLLEGPTSSGKTSAVRYMAYKTQSPYRRINLSYYTEVSDLLGKYVGGEKKYDRAALGKMTDAALGEVAADYGIEPDEVQGDRQGVEASILSAQLRPRWVDGPVVKAAKNGEVLLLDEMNLARPEVLERLNSMFDDDGNLVLTEHHNEVIEPDLNFRFFATMNPASYSGRARLSDAMRSRWTNVFAHGLDCADLTKIMTEVYGDQLPVEETAKLVAAHDNLSRLADEGEIGRVGGGVAFTLRNLFRVADRFVRYRDTGLSDAALMRREVEELYAGGLFEPDDIQSVQDILQTVMPYTGPSFYEGLELSEDRDTFQIGDVVLSKLDLEHTLIPGESSRLVMTDRTKQVLYRLAKALDMGENVCLVGDRACGKTALAKMFAMLRGQPYQRQLLSGSTDVMQLVGGYDDTGWKDGLLLDAGRPEAVPGIFLGDEFNLANPALLERLNSVLDDERKIVLAEKEGEEVRLHPEFRFIAAMNPPNRNYGGRNKLSKAMQNRFTMIAVPGLDQAEEQKEILQVIGERMGVDKAITDTLVDLHHWIDGAYQEGSLGAEMRERDRPVYSIRQLMNATGLVSEFSGEMGPGRAYLLAVQSTYASSPYPGDDGRILARAKELAR